MQTSLEKLKPALEALGEALLSGHDVEQAITNYENQAADLPAQYGWRMEYTIREYSKLNRISYIAVQKRSGWRILGGVKKTTDPTTLLTEHPRLATLFLSHHDGYAREEALKLIHHNRITPFILSIVSSRLNDWVEPVRQQALKTLIELVDHVSDKELQELVPFLIIRSAYWRRWKYEKSRFVESLTDPLFVVRVSGAIGRAKTGPMSRCLLVLSEYAPYDQTLVDLHRLALQPSVRARATKMLLDGYASVFYGYFYRRRLNTVQSIAEHVGSPWPARIEGDVTSERVKVFAQRPLEIEYDLDDVVWGAANDKSPFVRRQVSDFLISQLPELNRFSKAYELLKDDPHPFLIERMDFIRRGLEQEGHT